MATHSTKQNTKQFIYSLIQIVLGAFLAAYALEVFLLPNDIIDGGVVGVSILLGKVFGEAIIYPAVGVISIPFIAIAYKQISKAFVIQMSIAVFSFVMMGHGIKLSNLPFFHHYIGDLLEVVVVGGLILGLGVGLIIRAGACLDGTEILAILFNKKYGLSVGSVILVINIVIFIIAGFVFGDWHPPIKSLITFFVVIKIMDMVIVGFDEMKSVMIFTSKPQDISQVLMHEMGFGLTFIQAKGGYSGQDTKILYLIAERLQLFEIKSKVHEIDPYALVVIDNLHEVSTLENPKKIAKKLPKNYQRTSKEI